ncbi:hypothetical protein I317_05060 [Kwoniella heveanensis CBS 569]|uniref:beta-glucosidase n=1 Tax=Kwoniella heveanensis BCC8398 TaxID=1296120 RepID=A0A1B9GIR1_9TREE|nr:hypothetical protein I316_07484 [Kwoniella heveanensis BCC8398]OCF41146.1 hypothetical protein I317_05060 [Kwoniella heveanensis CBS 569]
MSKQLSADFDVEAVLADLTMLEKLKLIRGGSGFSTTALPEKGIGAVRMTDGPSGARGTKVFNGTRANCFPCAVGIGSSFDLQLVRDMALQLAAEARSKSTHILLGPTLNIIRSPLAGRGFEMFSEDPLLIGKIGATYIKTLESEGITACMKHFIGNEQETRKHTIDTIVSDRAMREIYLEPFRIAIREGNPGSVMASYSKIRGIHGSDSIFLMEEVLRKEWGWDGTMIADWYGTHSTATAIKAGLDLEMPGPTIWRTDAQVLSHIEAGILSENDIDFCARNVLKLVKRAVASGIPFDGPQETIDTPESRALLQRAAASAVVLLKNDKGVLPLSKSKEKPLKKIGVIGFNASQHFSSGGGAASVPLETFANSPLDGIRSAARSLGAEVEYALGTVAYAFVPPADPYFSAPGSRASSGDIARIEFWRKPPSDAWQSNEGDISFDSQPDYSFVTPSARCFMHDGVPDDIVQEAHYVKFTADFTPDQDGNWRIGLNSIDRAKLFVDGELVVDYSEDLKPGKMFFGFCYEERSAVLRGLNQGQKYRVELRTWDSAHLHGLPVKMPAGFNIGVIPELDAQDAIKQAVDLAKASDECIVVVGLNKEFETEGDDRTTMDLPGTADELVEAVLEVRPDAIIVTQSGMPVTMPWVTKATTLVHAFYGGTALGNGLADVIFGNVNPSAKLPISFPKRLEDSTSYPHFAHLSPSHKQVVYAEDIFLGYRGLVRTPERIAFPFGHGLSYTTFEYSDLQIVEEGPADFTIKSTITNTGAVAGAEVVQVYVRPLQPTLARPDKELKGFTKIQLTPQAQGQVTVKLDRSAFAFWDDRKDTGNWCAEQGKYVVLVAASSQDVRLVGEVNLKGNQTWRGL